MDKAVPKQLGDVSDTYHTPIKGILLCAVTGEIALFALVQIPQASLLGALLAQILAFIVVSIAGILFPYRLKAVWESAGGRRIFGVPAVTLAGIGGVIALGVLPGEFVFNSSISATFAVARTLSLEFMIGVIDLGAIWYVVAWRLNARKGINMGLAYREIPPE
jgi:amino acid transporter